MYLEYKNVQAEVKYSAVTKSYYGEISGLDYVISFQASNKQELVAAMQQAVDQFLARHSALLV